MTKHIDLTELNKVADGDQDFMKETIALLVEEIPANLDAIQNYVTNKDIVSLKKIVHKMKSSFMLIGMKDLWPIIATIEKSDSPETVLQEVPPLVEMCKESVEELKTMQNII